MGLLIGLFMVLMIAGGMAFAALAALLWVPFLILRFALRFVVLLFVVPIVLASVAFAFVVAGAALVFGLFLPLAPFIILAVLIWALTRHSQAATVVRG